MNRHERRAAKTATKRAKASLPAGIKLTRREIETRLQDAILRDDPVLIERLLSALIAEGGTLYEDLPAPLKDAIEIAVSDIKNKPWNERIGFIDELLHEFVMADADKFQSDIEEDTTTGFRDFGENTQVFLTALIERLDGSISKVDCNEQAMTYGLSLRPAHVQAALDWQKANPDQKTAIQQLITTLPGYAAVILTINDQVPAAYDALRADSKPQ